MSPGRIAFVISFIIIIIIGVILLLTVTSYDSTKETSPGLRFGILISAIFISALANVIGDFYVIFINNALNTRSSKVA